MTRNMMIGLGAAAIIIVGGGAAYMLTQEDKPADTSNSQSDSSSSGASFNPASTEDAEFKATINTEKDGQETTATLEHDDQGNSRYVTNTGGQQTEVIYTADAYYTCGGDNCVKFPIGQSSGTGINLGDYTYDQSKIADYRAGADYQGQESCPAGTCDVWKTTAGGGTSIIFIDTDSKRISQVVTTIGGATSRIVYDYTDVTITIPTNAQEINVPPAAQ